MRKYSINIENFNYREGKILVDKLKEAVEEIELIEGTELKAELSDHKGKMKKEIPLKSDLKEFKEKLERRDQVG